MSSFVPPTSSYPAGSNALQHAQAELGQTEAFAEAEKQFAEPTPQAPNTDSSGNSRVQEQARQQTNSDDGNARHAASSELHQSDSFQQSAQTPQAPSRQSQTTGTTQSSSNSNSPSAAQPSTSFQPSSTPAASANTASTSNSSARAGADTLDSNMRSTSSANTSTSLSQSTASSSAVASTSDHASAQLDASLTQDLAAIAGASQTTTVRVESLGNSDAMTRELLAAIADSGADAVKATPETQAALAAMTQKTVDNIPHMLVENEDSKGVRLFVPDSHMANQTEAAEARVLTSDSTRIQAAAELSQGPDWPHMMLEALSKANGQWVDRFPDSNAMQNAMMSLFGREVSMVQAGAHEEMFNRLASLSNPPLNLPVAGLMHNELNQLTAFSVQQTHMMQDGHMWMTVLDMPASLEAGREVYKTMQAEQFAKVVYVMVVPDGRPAVAIQKQHEADFNTLGLAGCCLTANGSSDARHGSSIRASASRRHGTGLLENRCVTCARAQQLCQPKLV